MATWTDPQLVIDSWIGEDRPTDIALVTIWVGRAERLLRRRVPSLSARIDSALEEDLLDRTADVVSAMVQRVFRNPEGVRQRQETTGSFSGSTTYGGDNPGVLEVLPEEASSLVNGQAGPRKAFSVDMIPPASEFATHRWPTL